MAKSNKKTDIKAETKKDNTVQKNAEKSVEEIEADLQLPQSSDEEGEDQNDEDEEEQDVSELSDESDDEDDDLRGLSSEEVDDDKEEVEMDIKSKIKRDGHLVNKTVISSEAKASKKSKRRGIIYLGRLPQGFQEPEMKKYFSQFGNIINLKLSRNKKTGRSKHYGFIEFDNFEIAKIAAESMNNYLIFGHLLRCEVVETANEDLFKNTEKNFKVIPWKKISKHKNDKPKSKEQWGKLVEKYENQKLKKQAQLKEKGIDFDLNSL